MTADAALDDDHPTVVRYAIVAVTTLTSFILYLDRVCMGTISNSESFRADLGLSEQDTGKVLSAFFLAYALFQVPSGWFSDRFGARRMMCFYVAAWSVCTSLTGLAPGLWTLLAARFACGLAQAGAYPTSGGLLSRWIPLSRRALASSIVAFGGRVGGAMAPKLTVTLLIGLTAYDRVLFVGVGDWRWVLHIYAIAGLVIAWLFWTVFRESPDAHPWVNDAERAVIAHGRAPVANPSAKAAIPWQGLLTSRSMWLMCASQFGTNIGWVFLATWVNKYLTEVHHVTPAEEGTMTTTILLCGMAGMPIGGWLTDRLTRTLGLRWGRIAPLAASRLMAMSAYIVCLNLDSPWAATAALAVVSFSTDLGAGPTWAYAQDVGGRSVGAVLGWANMWGNLGATLLPYVTPMILKLDTNHDWLEVLLFCAGGFLLSALAVLGVDPRKPIVRESGSPS